MNGTIGHAMNKSTITSSDNVHNCNDSLPTVTLTAPSNCNNSCTIDATIVQGTHPFNDPQYPNFPGHVTFTLNGNVIKTLNVNSSPSTISFIYNPTTSGSGTLIAIATDSVLYQGRSNSITLNYSGH